MNISQTAQAILSHQHLSAMDLKAVDIDLSALSLSEIENIEQHQAFPLFKYHDLIFVVTSNVEILSSFSQLFNMAVKIIVVNQEELDNKDFILRYDAARLSYLLDHNKSAGLMLAKWLAKFDYRATDCYLKQEVFPLFFKKWKFWLAIVDGIIPAMDIRFATFDQTVVVEEYDNLVSGLRPLVAHQPIKIILEEQAIDYIYFFLNFSVKSARVVSPENFEEFDVLDKANEQRWENVRKQITQPSAIKDKNGYTVSLWLIKETNLYQGSFKIDQQGAISSFLTLIEPSIAYNSFFDGVIE